MTVTQTSSEQNTTDEIRCPHCDSLLPAYAAFCGICGKRVEPLRQGNSQNAQVEQQQVTGTGEANAERYRITALVGRRPNIQLFLALDTLFQRPVTICDINVSALDAEERSRSFRAAQHDFDVLRRARIPGLTPLIDVRSSDDHILLVGGWPFPLPETGHVVTRTHTLEDLLQSGLGLPDEQVALSWIHRLCSVVGQLHRTSIVVGTIDPGSVVVSTASYAGQPALMVSWPPQEIRTLLTQAKDTKEVSRFSAPETRNGIPEARSDLFSLGTLLFLLLTGTTPGEDISPRAVAQQLRERTPRLTKGTEELVLRAMASHPSERFQNADEMSEALQQQLASIAAKKRGRYARSAGSYPLSTGESDEGQGGSDTGEATISVVPIRTQLARWHLSRQDTQDMTNDVRIISAQMSAVSPEPAQQSVESQEAQDIVPGRETQRPSEPLQPAKPVETGESNSQEASHQSTIATQSSHEQDNEHMAAVEQLPTVTIPPILPETQSSASTSPVSSQTSTPERTSSLRQRITGIIPAFPKRTSPRVAATQADLDASSKPALLAWLQRLIVGEQQQRTTAAALIETPLRVQPNQSYTIRIHLMGRDAPASPKGGKKGAQPVGLSALKHDEIVHIEVRSAIYQNYAYIVQRADVHIPAEGFAAEVTIPMQPLSGGQNGRRERLHIFFMDELRQPLYERPFVLEIFVSHLVQAGKEGHSVMSIPV